MIASAINGKGERLDDGMGMLLEKLEQSGRAEDTLVIFVGDHGPPFERGKTSNYEAGLRVPLISRLPFGHLDDGLVLPYGRRTSVRAGRDGAWTVTVHAAG